MGAVAVAVREGRVRVRVDAVLVALGVLVGLAAVLRFATLSNQSFWIDESLTAHRTTGSFYDMLAAVHRPAEAEPPLYFFLVWPWARVFGRDEFGLRSLSAVFGILTVPVAFAIGKTLVNRWVGLVVAAFVAVSPVMIWFSQEARSYALFILLSAVSFLFFVRLLESPRPFNYVGWSVASSLALITHYFALFPLIGEAAWVLWRWRSRETLLAVGGIGVTGLAISPIALYQKRHGATSWLPATPFGRRLHWVGQEFVTGVEHPTHDLTLAVGIVCVCAVALVIVSGRSRPRYAATVGLAVAAVAIGIPLLGAAVGQDYVFDRYFLAAWIPLAVAVASIVAVPRWSAAGFVVAALICGAFLYYDHAIATTKRLQRDDWRHIPRVLGRPNQPRAVVITPWWQEKPLSWYEPCLRKMPGPRVVGEVDSVVYLRSYSLVRITRQLQPGPPFRMIRRSPSWWVTVTRFRAPRPTVVSPSALLRSAPDPSAQVYFEPRRAGRAPPAGGPCR